MLSVKNLSKTLGDFALRNVSFHVREGEYFALLGTSGAGKTILLEMIAGLLRPDAGQIFLAGRDVTCEKIQNRNIGLVYQDQALFPHLTVYQNVAYGARRGNLLRTQVHKRVQELAHDVGIDHLLNRRPQGISGGEAQRVALARSLATEPHCLLLDEPISSLDVRARFEIRALLRKIHRSGQTVVHVTHDYEEAVSLGSRIGIIENGRITQVGTPQQVFARPKSEFVARFVGIRNVFKGELKAQDSAERGLVPFVTQGVTFAVLTDAKSVFGTIMFRSEDVTVSNMRLQTSARNTFEGSIVDIEPARLGCNVLVDIGVNVWALVTAGSIEKLNLSCGKRVWVNVKASAIRFIGE